MGLTSLGFLRPDHKKARFLGLDTFSWRPAVTMLWSPDKLGWASERGTPTLSPPQLTPQCLLGSQPTDIHSVPTLAGSHQESGPSSLGWVAQAESWDGGAYRTWGNPSHLILPKWQIRKQNTHSYLRLLHSEIAYQKDTSGHSELRSDPKHLNTCASII